MRISKLSSLILIIVCIVLVAGCSVPGARRLESSPKAMPATLNYLPGNSLGWVITKTQQKDPVINKLVKELGGEGSFAGALLEPIFGDANSNWSEAINPWVGVSVGRAITTLRTGEASRLTFADVKKRSVLEKTLVRYGWVKQDNAKPLMKSNNDLTLWSRETSRKGELSALAIANDALVGAENEKYLRALLGAADSYAASDRPSFVDFTIDAMKASPIAFVYSSDAIRNDLRTLVGDDPALTEASRWITQTSSIYALRDGWLAAKVSAKNSIRLFGKIDRAKSATSVPDPKAVEKPSNTDLAKSSWAVAFDNPGAYLDDALLAITKNGLNFTTELDRPKDVTKLRPFLAALDGSAIVKRDSKTGETILRVKVHDTNKLKKKAIEVFKTAGISGLVDVSANSDIELQFTFKAKRKNLSEYATVEGDPFSSAGVPSQKPFIWGYLASSFCDSTRSMAGWGSWDPKQDRIMVSLSLPLDKNLKNCSFQSFIAAING